MYYVSKRCLKWIYYHVLDVDTRIGSDWQDDRNLIATTRQVNHTATSICYVAVVGGRKAGEDWSWLCGAVVANTLVPTLEHTEYDVACQNVILGEGIAINIRWKLV